MSRPELRQNVRMAKRRVQRYLSVAQFAERIGVKRDTLNRYNLPEPDVFIGDIRGWKPETIDAWNAARPGSGRWAASREVAPRARKIAPPSAGE
jgi:hypothetical protein